MCQIASISENWKPRVMELYSRNVAIVLLCQIEEQLKGDQTLFGVNRVSGKAERDRMTETALEFHLVVYFFN